jgi:hypothetical protein
VSQCSENVGILVLSSRLRAVRYRSVLRRPVAIGVA